MAEENSVKQTEEPKIKCFFCRKESLVSKGTIKHGKTSLGFSALMCPSCTRANGYVAPGDPIAQMSEHILTEQPAIETPETGEPVIASEDVEALREDPQGEAAKKILANIFCRTEPLFDGLTGEAAINACTTRIIFLEQIQAAIRAEIYAAGLIKGKKTREAQRGEQLSAVEFERKMRSKRLAQGSSVTSKPTSRAKVSEADLKARAAELFQTEKAQVFFVIMMKNAKSLGFTEESVCQKIKDQGYN